ncbi:DUF3040 domain-containing protein [Corynebacterium frankenforstense]
MALSEQERQTLREIEESLLADDPKFGSSVGDDSGFTGGAPGGSITLRGVALGVLGLLMLLGGAMLAQQSLWFIALSVAGFLVMLGAGIWMLRGGSAGGWRTSARYGSRPRAATGGGRQGSGFSRRMEDDFRRRFEGR